MVAYLVMSYSAPVERLVATLRAGSPDAVIAVHHDSARCGRWARSTRSASSRGRSRGATGRSCSPSCTACAGCATARDWFVLLSGQDYPVAPASPRSRPGCTAPTPSSRPRPVAPLDLAPRHGRTSSRAATGCAGGRSRRASRALAAKADPLAHVRTLPGGTYLGPARAQPPLPPFHGSDWFTLSRRAVDARARRAGRRARPLPAHDRPDRGVRRRPCWPNSRAAAASTTTAATRASSPDSPNPRVLSRRPRRRARVRRRLRPQVRRSARCWTSSTGA